ncbi:MAG: twin-arginine translocase subunit TatC [Bacteroidales bacterium]|nr:twin-arginine translocase subunit TatC [Bacteroidales bacterium]
MAEEREREEMTFWDHLDVLRGTLFRSAVAVMVAAVAFFIFKDQLFRFVFAPTKDNFLVYRWFGSEMNMTLVNLEISAQFFIHLKMALMCGVIVAVPYIIYEIWRFISPALYDTEKKPIRSAFLLASVLFYIGAVVGYLFVLPVCINFFMNYTISDEVLNTISLDSYISMFTSMVLMIGIVFEFPAVIAVLSKLGLIFRSTLRKLRKYAVVVILIISAIITPSDPFSMFVLAVPLYALYEFSIILCRKDPEPEE